MRQLLVAAFFAVALVGGLRATANAETYVPHETRFDHRVDRLTDRQLLTQPPQALVDPNRRRAARTIADLRAGLGVGWALAQIFVFFWLWQSGRAARIRDLLRRRFWSRTGSRAAFGAVLGLAAPLAALPFGFVIYRIGFNVGLTEEIIGAWLVHYAFTALAGAIGAAIVTVVVLALVDRTRLWYLWTIAFLYSAITAVVALDPIVFSPIITQTRPVDVVAAAPVEIARSSMRTRTITARTAGIGPFARILLGDVLVAETTPAEQRFVVARESAHVRNHDLLKYTLFATTLLVFCAAFGVLIADRIPFRRDDDPVSRLALVGATTGLVAALAFPLFNAYSRGMERRADIEALHVTHDPAAAVRLIVRRADDDLVPLCNRRSYGWYFANRIAPGTRIAELRGTSDPCPR